MQARDYSTEGTLALVGAMLQKGRHSPDFWREPCVRQWATLAGLDPDAMQVVAASPTPRVAKPPYRQCFPKW